MTEEDEPDWESPEPDPPSPGPDPPSVGDEYDLGEAVGGADADSEAARLFWRLVLVVDVGVLALALGPMFVYFEGNWQRGLAFSAFGVVVLLYGVVRYRRYRQSEETGEDDAAMDPDR